MLLISAHTYWICSNPDRSFWLPPPMAVAPPFSDLTGSQMLQSLWSLVGVPTIAVPCGRVDGLPIGVQLIAAPHREDFLLHASDFLSDSISS